VNVWVLYRRHCNRQGILKKNQKSQLKFALELVDLLIAVNKTVPSADNVGEPGKSAKRKSVEVRLYVGAKACHTKS
jgi:hypothetical protein